MGRVLFTPKAEPAIDWSEIESRLHDISAPAPSSDLPIEPSAPLANDPPAPNDPAAADPEAVTPSDPLELLSLLTALPSKKS